MKHYIPTGRHGILVPKFKDLVVNGMVAQIGMEGRFRLITHSRRYGSQVRADFKNLILNQGLDRVGQGAWIGSCQVGTGSTTPAVGQTGLASFFAGSSTQGATDVDSYTPGPPPYHQLVRVCRFAEGTFSGTNITEVGMGWANTGSALFSRALILDGGGNPTSITVLSDETLDVEYTLRVFPPTADVAGSVVLDGTSYDYTLRAANVGKLNFGGWPVSGLVSSQIGGTAGHLTNRNVHPAASVLGDIFNVPTLIGAQISKGVAKTYIASSYSRGFEMTAGLSVNPSGGVGAARFSVGSANNGSGAQLQIGFSPAIPKDNTKILVLEPRIHWARR